MEKSSHSEGDDHEDEDEDEVSASIFNSASLKLLTTEFDSDGGGALGGFSVSPCFKL